MINWIKGKPKRDILCCLVFYQEDYEFGRLMNGEWDVYCMDYWVPVKDSEIQGYAMLNEPE
jgi:hypothetical protein